MIIHLLSALILVIYGHSTQESKVTGEQLYIKYCLQCHQQDGNGVRNMFPPLAGNPKVNGPASDIIKIVLSGLQGPVEVNGRDYDQSMPAQDYLDDDQIASILTYVRKSWGNKAPAVKAEEVKKIRALKPKSDMSQDFPDKELVNTH